MSSLYEKLGGAAAVNAAVDLFYRKVLLDNSISHFFDGISMNEQIAKQKAFLTVAFGGPNNYSGKDLRAAHAKFKLNDAHFNAVATHLKSTLQELNVANNLIDEVMAIAGSTYKEVLNI